MRCCRCGSPWDARRAATPGSRCGSCASGRGPDPRARACCPVTSGYRLGRRRRTGHDGGMTVVEINIGPSEALAPVESVRVVAGQGVIGDRQFAPGGALPGEALTLIEAEALEDVGLT